jgi:TetR/AcrR family tetracycline transcriptional repressor
VRERAIRAALDLLNEFGIEGVTTRRIAERLGVRSPTLYWHFKSKQALLNEMTAAMMTEEARPQPAAFDDWRAWLAADAGAFRRALARYRDGALVHAGSSPPPSQYAEIEGHMRVLCDAGFSPGRALEILIIVSRYVVGWMIDQQSDSSEGPDFDAARFPLLSAGIKEVKTINSISTFERGLQALIRGLAETHERS